MCVRCVSDTTIPRIRFDESGQCTFCKIHDKLDALYPLDEGRQERLDRLADKIKAAGRKSRYDCIIGVSGGTDSTYTLYMSRELGLRPLAVHLNNTWDTDIATENMKRAVGKLEVDFRETHCDWDEYRALQVAFLKASVPDAEAPSDMAIHATLHQVAAEEGVRFVLNGHSFRTEGVAPLGWSYLDSRYINDVYRVHGPGGRLKSFPNLTMSRFLWYTYLKRIKVVPFLNYFDYSKERARGILERELDWTYYGGHHCESVYTHFVLSYLQWRKFGIDKRKIGFSAQIRSGLMARDQALAELQEPPPIEADAVKHCIDRLGLSQGQFDEIMQSPRRTLHDYRTYYPMLRAARPLIKAATRLRLVSPLLYEKFFN